MTSIVVAMFVIVAVAVSTVGLVAVGLQGRWSQRTPRLAARLSRAARHLSGEAPAPDRFLRLMEHPFSR